MKIRNCLIPVMAIVLSACASIDFLEVQNDGSEKDAGFLYYPPKPYLLVETKEGNLIASVISLPDLSRPHRVRQDNGWGSAELGFEIEHGMIKTFNSKTDSKGPETLTSIAGLASFGTAQAAIETAKAATLTAELAAGETVEMKMAGIDEGTFNIPVNYRVQAFVESISLLQAEVIPPLQSNSEKFAYEIETVRGVIGALIDSVVVDYDPQNPDALLSAVEERRKIAKKLAEILKNVSSTLLIYAENKAEQPGLILPAKNAHENLKEVVKTLLKFSIRNSAVAGVYEIDYIDGRLNLRKVVFE